ncbi:MAG: nickel pincer cofactor biosynthesis protein LarB [Lachnospiraceae bacterium]|nr:nickel pincer cofactor biosynthesis protein LarB [Lachnospiraceae bacterium]
MKDIEHILAEMKEGVLSAGEAAGMIRSLAVKESYEDLGYAKVDLDRQRRRGNSEVIYGAGKTAAQIEGIAETLIGHGQGNILITRLSEDKAGEIKEFIVNKKTSFEYDSVSRIGIIGGKKRADGAGSIAVVTGGTSDMPVAEEAAQTAEFFGNKVVRLYDMGVAGIHRLFAHYDEILAARVIIVIAGMEGALASVVGGLVSVPVIAVPTSVGYGASFGGISALLSMLNSCASGVTVVNIDNGYGAAYQASMINHIGI